MAVKYMLRGSVIDLRESDRPHDVMVILSLAGNVNKARCSCAAGENGYCNHTMGV